MKDFFAVLFFAAAGFFLGSFWTKYKLFNNAFETTAPLILQSSNASADSPADKAADASLDSGSLPVGAVLYSYPAHSSETFLLLVTIPQREMLLRKKSEHFWTLAPLHGQELSGETRSPSGEKQGSEAQHGEVADYVGDGG